MERTVFGDVVQVVAADDDSTGHLGRDDTASHDTATDGDIAGEGALLVCGPGVHLCMYTLEALRTNVSALDRLGRGLEAQTNILIPPLLLSGDLLAT